MNIPQIDSNFRELDDILHAGYAPNVISTAMELGLFDALSEEPMDARTLSDRLGTLYEITEAFANVLVALNLLAKNGADYSLAPLSKDFLVKSSPAYQGGMIAMASQHGQIMEKMPETLKNGPPEAFNSSMWASAEFMKVMGQGVLGGSIQDATGFISALPEFPNLHRMCDLGGNHGFYTMALIDRNPRLRGTICDLPKVVKLAKDVISEMGYSDRIDTIGCDLETDGSMDNDCCGPVSGTMMELMTRLCGYPTHHLSEEELKSALAACGFGDFAVRPADEGRQYRSLILAARKLE
jgi:hypothetical protein